METVVAHVMVPIIGIMMAIILLDAFFMLAKAVVSAAQGPT